MEQDNHSDEQIKKILEMRNVVVIGMSRHSEKAAHFVPKYLIENGFNVTPVNPTADEILGKKCFKEIIHIPHDIDIVDVFRPSEQVLSIIKDSIKKNPKVIWLQEGIHNEEAEQLTRDSGIDVVFNRCMLAEHRRLM